MTSLDTHWRELVAAALLGTDRREPPHAPPGPLADLAADDPRPDAPGRVLQQAAAVTVSRRAGLAPVRVDLDQVLAPPDADTRPTTSPDATGRWHRIARDWPVLEDEWLVGVLATGRRLSPELVVPLLLRHRGDPVRHLRVRRAAGPLADWLIDWSPRLGTSRRQAVDPAEAAALPELAVTPELASLLAVGPEEPLPPSGGALAGLVGELLVGPLHAGYLAAAHRPVLVNLLARIHPGVLHVASDGLRAIVRSPTARPGAETVAAALDDMVTLRREMLADLSTGLASRGTPSTPPTRHPPEVT